jgi:hypothetical protein
VPDTARSEVEVFVAVCRFLAAEYAACQRLGTQARHAPLRLLITALIGAVPVAALVAREAAREAAEDANATVQRQKRRRAEEPTAIAVAPESASALGSTFTFTALGSTIPDTLQVKLLSEALKVAADEATRATLSHRELLADAAKRQNELTAQLKGAVTHCEKLRAELRRFKRIPITETMGVVEESKLEQVTYSIGADSIRVGVHKRLKFGSEAPKQLPTDRPLEHEGWVYKFNCGVMGFEKKVCAVYYFD